MRVASEVTLGVRLATGTRRSRYRTLLVGIAAAVGACVLLVVFTVALTALTENGSYSASEQQRLLTAIVAAVALPVVALSATVGRLSASVRDRRLANLRLLGLSSRRTRTVAAVEAGVGAVAGTVGGVVAALVARMLLDSPDSSNTVGDTASVASQPLAYVLVVLIVIAVPAVAIGVAALPQRLTPQRVLARASQDDATRPPAWRLAPLLVGVVACAWVASTTGGPTGTQDPTNTQALIFMTGACLTGLGLVLVSPVFVRLTADLLLRTTRAPAALMAARRLQAQPVAVTRVVAALMVGLFLVTGARAVLASFESTPQYVVAERAMNAPYLVSIQLDPAADPDQAAATVAGVAGARAVSALPVLVTQCGPTPDYVCDAVVATCEQLAPYLNPATTDCRNNETQWANRAFDGVTGPLTVRVKTTRESDGLTLGAGASVAVDAPSPAVLSSQADNIEGSLADLPFTLRIPPTTPGIDTLTATTARTVFVSADPGPALVDNLRQVDLGDYGYQAPTFEDYDFVARISSIIWLLAALILGIGLMAFAIAAIDRAISRRQELTAMLLLGMPPRTIRRAQLIEALIPTATGTVLAILAGIAVGTSYLAATEDTQGTPWTATLVLTALALATSTAVAGLTVLGTPARLNPSRIRTE